MAEMRAGRWVTQASNDDPLYRMAFVETDERLQAIVEEVRADGFDGLVLSFEEPAFVERSGKVEICLSGDMWVGAVLADDWELWEAPTTGGEPNGNGS